MTRSQDFWNERWQNRDSHDGWKVDNWLLQQEELLHKGTALDVACGRGRNALFLAQHGYQVTAIDYSAIALKQLQAEAQEFDLQIATAEIDLEKQPQLPQGPFDLVINFYYLHRPLLPQLKELVKPGGLLIMRTFSEVIIDEPCCLEPQMVLKREELLETFKDWQILRYEEGIETSKKGGSLVGLVARKPETA